MIKSCVYDKRADYAVVAFKGKGYHREVMTLCRMLPPVDRVWCIPSNTWTIRGVRQWLPVFKDYIPTLYAALVPFLSQIRMFDEEETEKEEALRQVERYRRPDTTGVLLRGLSRDRS